MRPLHARDRDRKEAISTQTCAVETEEDARYMSAVESVEERPIKRARGDAMKPSTEENEGQTHMDIDEDLHSRQLAVYGRETMRKMAAADVLICGMNGLGAEVGACKEHRRNTRERNDARDAATNQGN